LQASWCSKIIMVRYNLKNATAGQGRNVVAAP
jgi:hypothetical protein